MNKTILPMPESVGYREALRSAKQAGVIMHSPQPKAIELEGYIRLWNAKMSSLDDDACPVATELSRRLKAIDWTPVHALAPSTRRYLLNTAMGQLKVLWGID